MTRMMAPGTVLAGKLRVERVIGQGAMGVVFEAIDVTLSKRVAVKLVHPDHMGDPETRLRFGREAYAIARLDSPHVTKVLEISELDDGTPYLVMELLEGHTLDAILERQGRVSIDLALDWMLQALDAVAEAHAIGLVHRDLKPANLFLAKKPGELPIIKVIDFGLVKDNAPGAAKLTVKGSTMGSPAYMAPEQINPERALDARADVWALGVTLFELVTGALPFDAPTIPTMLQRILHDAPATLSAYCPDAPPDLEAVVQRCLAKDPAVRFADGAELSAALAAVRARIPKTTESTRTVRLPEGTSVAAYAAGLAEPFDASAVRPRVGAPPEGDGREAAAGRPDRALRAVVIAAASSCIAITALAVMTYALVRKRYERAETPAAAASTVSAAPSANATSPPTPSQAPSRSDVPRGR